MLQFYGMAKRMLFPSITDQALRSLALIVRIFALTKVSASYGAEQKTLTRYGLAQLRPMASRTRAQIANAISTGGPFSVTFPSELTASVSVFRLSGAAMATAGGNPP